MKNLISNFLIALLILSFPATVLAGGSSVGIYETNVEDKYLTAGQSDQLLMSFTVEPWEFIEHDFSLRSMQVTCTPSRALREIKLMQGETQVGQSSFVPTNFPAGSQTAVFGKNDFIIPNGQQTEFQLLVSVAENSADYSTACAIANMKFYHAESGKIYAIESHDTHFDGVDTLIHIDSLNDDTRTENYEISEYNSETQNLETGTLNNLLTEFDISPTDESNYYLEDIFVHCENAGIIQDARLTTDSKTIPLSVSHTTDYTYGAHQHGRDRTFVFTNTDLIITTENPVHFELYGDTYSYFSYPEGTITSCSVLNTRINTEPVLVFTDINKDHVNFTAINTLFWEGTLKGYEDGTFRPDQNMTRAEFVHLIIPIETNAMPTERCFSDVYGDWYGKDVCYAKTQGWIQGYPDGSFQPGGNINKAEALKILMESRQITVESMEDEEWYAPYVNKASELELFDENVSDFQAGEKATRGDISEYLYRLEK